METTGEIDEFIVTKIDTRIFCNTSRLIHQITTNDMKK